MQSLDSTHSAETTMSPHSLGKGKIIRWKKLKKKLKFTAAFKSFSSDWYFEESTFNNLEEYVCMLYGQNNKDTNAARSNMFLQKYSSISKVIDLAVLLPCRSVLYLHAQRANYVAKIWKSSNCWLENGEIDWVETVFPDDIEDILVDPEFDINSNNSDDDDISDEECES